MIYFPVIAAVMLAGGTILQKTILKRKEVDVKKYQVLEFLALVIVMLPLLYLFWKVDSQALQLKNILIFTIVIVCSVLANFFSIYSMKGEKISNLEPAKMLEPLFVILLAVVFSFFFKGAYESNLKVLIASIVAGIAIVIANVKKENLRFNKYFIAATIGSLLFAFEIIISNLILEFYSPLTFYFIRCFGVLIFSFILFRPKLSKIDNKLKIDLLMTGVILVSYRVIAYYGYLKIGIVSTTLILMFGAVLTYAFAKIFLKERINKRNIIASIILIVCILCASFT